MTIRQEGTRQRTLFILTCAALVLCVGAVGVMAQQRLSYAGPSSAEQASTEEVIAYGAIGDGVHDDTMAFVDAIAAAQASGKPVHVPMGKYRITDTLVVNAVSVVGDPSGSWTSDSATLPTILPTNPAASAFKLEDGGALQGLNFEYAHANPDVPTHFAATIILDGVGTKVQDVRINKPWIGIDTMPGTDNTGRALIQNVFLSWVGSLGIRLDKGYDTTTLDNVEVWTPTGVLGNNFGNSGTGIVSLYNDALRMSNVFVYGAKTGILFDDSTGGTWGNMSNVATDFCGTGIHVVGTHHLTYTGGTSWSHNYAFWVDGEYADVTISGAEFRANSGAALRVSNAWSVAISGSSLQRDETGGSGPAILAEGSKYLTVTGNFLNAGPVGVQFGSNLLNVVLTNNTINVQDGVGVGIQNGGPAGMASVINNNMIK